MTQGIIASIDNIRRIGFIHESRDDGSSVRRFFGFYESSPYHIKNLSVGDLVEYSLAPDRDVKKPEKAVFIRKIGAPDILWDWAYFPNRNVNLLELAALALPEPWHFGHRPDPERPAPVLYNYLQYTFLKVQMDGKLAYSADKAVAAFNTGLVTPMFLPIIAVFRQNIPTARQPFILEGFCVPGERGLGKEVMRLISDELLAPKYVTDISDYLYVAPHRTPDVDWHHVIVDGIAKKRFPLPFVRDVCRDALKDLQLRNASDEDFWKILADYMLQENEGRTMRLIQSRVNEALDKSLKRVRWNYRTTVPMWYPNRSTMLLLPLSLTKGKNADLALVVEQIKHSDQNAKYIGHTVLTLDWAYMNARLICRPDSDWLRPEHITSSCSLLSYAKVKNEN